MKRILVSRPRSVRRGVASSRAPLASGALSWRRLRASLTFVCFGAGLCTFVGCTFTDIAGYEIGECDPSVQNLAQDPCNRLNNGGGCEIYQCDRAKHRCMPSPRDEDRDGDPSLECGGADCDDHDPAVSGIQQEKCDGKDNDCDGIVDEEVLQPHAPEEVAQTGALPTYPDVTVVPDGVDGATGAYVAKAEGGLCIQAVRLLGPKPDFLLPGCSFLSDTPTVVPRQPQVRTLPQGGAGVAFVETTGCSQGMLGYRYTGPGTAGALDEPCDGPGVALPSWAVDATGKSAIVTWYGVSLEERQKPIDSCESASAAPLWFAPVSDPGSDGPLLGSKTMLAAASIGVRPAAIVPLGAAGGFLVAAPVEPDTGVWFVGSDQAAQPMIHLSGLVGSRSTAMAIAPGETGQFHVAVVAEIGCAPQSIKLALGSGAGPEKLEFSPVIDVVAAGTTIATQPSVNWVAARREWVVTWITNDGPAVMARRFTLDGSAIDGAIRVGQNIVAGAVSSGSIVVGFDGVDASFNQIRMVCP